MYIFGKDISEPVYFGVHYLEMYILGNEKLLDVYFRDKPSYRFVFVLLAKKPVRTRTAALFRIGKKSA